MDQEYLKTKEDLRLVRSALSTAQTLENAEKILRESKETFREISQNIINDLGFELWHTDVDGGKYFWRWNKRESKHYATRVTALKALYDEDIDWGRS